MAAQDWDIKSLGRVCSVSEEPFEDKEEIYSCLTHTEEGYQRLDVKVSHWTAELRDNAISYWKTFYIAPPPPQPEAVRKETAESLLRQYMSKEDFSKSHVIFILAVMLERKRILVEKDVTVREDGTKLRIYEHKKSGEMFTIPDPELKLNELEKVQVEVNQLLGIPSREDREKAVSAESVSPETAENTDG